MSTAAKSREQATYVAPHSDKEWLLDVQRKLYARSWENPDYVFCKLWGFVVDPRNLRCSLMRIAHNQGRRTAGVDGVTVRMILEAGVDALPSSSRRSASADTASQGSADIRRSEARLVALR